LPNGRTSEWRGQSALFLIGWFFYGKRHVPKAFN
jgi:hypothetical protein